jgi:hypothetical protein
LCATKLPPENVVAKNWFERDTLRQKVCASETKFGSKSEWLMLIVGISNLMQVQLVQLLTLSKLI